jgi:opacity protein-like surface antigen
MRKFLTRAGLIACAFLSVALMTSLARAQIADINEIEAEWQGVYNSIDGDLKYNPDQCLSDAQRAEMLSRIAAAREKLDMYARIAVRGRREDPGLERVYGRIDKGIVRLVELYVRVKKYPRCAIAPLGTWDPIGPNLFALNVGVAGGFASTRSTTGDQSTSSGGTSFGGTGEGDRLNSNGGVLGATFGVRWPGQNNMFAGVQGNILFPLATARSNDTSSAITTKLDALMTADFLVGSTFVPNPAVGLPVSVYGFVGLAAGRLTVSQSDLSATNTLFGPTVGLGVEVKVRPRVALFGELRYSELFAVAFVTRLGSSGISVGERATTAMGGVRVEFPGR